MASGTDSEALFCYILDHIEKHAILNWSEKNFIDFWKFLIVVNRRPRRNHKKRHKLNVLMTDGTTVIAYSDVFGRGTLHRLMILCCETLLVGSAPSDCSQDKKNPERSIAVFATKPLDDHPGWVSMARGELCAFRNGMIVFRSDRNGRRKSVEKIAVVPESIPITGTQENADREFES